MSKDKVKTQGVLSVVPLDMLVFGSHIKLIGMSQ